MISSHCRLHEVSLNAKMHTGKREPANSGEIPDEGTSPMLRPGINSMYVAN